MHLSIKLPSYTVGLALLVQMISACAPSASQQTSSVAQQNVQQTDSSEQIVLSVAEMVKSLSIRANVQGKGWDEIDPLMHSNVVLFGWDSHDQAEMYNLYHSKAAQGDFYNAGYYANLAIDKTLDLAMDAPIEAEAIAFWKAAQWDGQQGFTAKGNAAWAWLVNLNHTYFVNTYLDIGTHQVEPHGHGWPITTNIAQWKWTCN